MYIGNIISIASVPIMQKSFLKE